MIKEKITNILLSLSLAVLLFGSGYRLGNYRAKFTGQLNQRGSLETVLGNKAANKANIDLSLFWNTWQQLEQKYVDKKKLNKKQMVYGAIKGMVASVKDPYTFFLTPQENKQSKDDLAGEFEGIGAQLGLKNGQIVVIAPLNNSPAEKAGVKGGDLVLKVNHQSTKNWTLIEAVKKIRGKQGTKVVITMGRNNKEIDIPIIRGKIEVPSVELSYETESTCRENCSKAAVIKVNQFGNNTINEWDRSIDKVVRQWHQKKIKGLVIDLRNNPGGFLQSAVYLTSEFLPQKKVVVKQESTSLKNKIYLVERKGKLLNIPLVVLINGGSASASEIMAGALRDHRRAKLVGEKSFGKGSVQDVVDLQGGAGLHVTIAKWILPNGDWINGKGIKPDIEVKNNIDKANTLTREADKQLDTALETLLK